MENITFQKKVHFKFSRVQYAPKYNVNINLDPYCKIYFTPVALKVRQFEI